MGRGKALAAIILLALAGFQKHNPVAPRVSAGQILLAGMGPSSSVDPSARTLMGLGCLFLFAGKLRLGNKAKPSADEETVD